MLTTTGYHKAEEGLKLSARSMSRMWVKPLFLQEHFCWFAKYRLAKYRFA
jgi:hypothetical protein